MAQVTASVGVLRRRFRSAWRPIAVVCGLVLAFASIAVTMLNKLSWQADRGYRAAVADADGLDPGWRLDDLMAKREKVPDDVNSALRVHAIFEQLPGGWPGITHYDTSFFFEGETPEVRPAKARIEQLEEVLDTVAGMVAQARRLSEFPRGQLEGTLPRIERLEPIGGLNAFVDVSFPYAEEVRRVVFMLCLDAKLRIEAGDLDSAITDIKAMVCAGRSIGEYPGLTAQSTRSGVCWTAAPCLETALAQGEVRAGALAALQSLFELEARQPHRSLALRGERAITNDLLEQIRADKLGFRAIPDFSQYPFWMRTFTNRINLRETQARLLRFQTRAALVDRLPEAEQISAMKSLNDEWVKQAQQWGFMERNQRLAERLLFGSMVGTPTWLGMDDALIRTAIAALATERFRLEQGRWPDSLDELVPMYLTAVPRDPFLAAPLKLRKPPDGLIVYSVGYDGRDDGGKIDPSTRMRGGADLGFRLWDVGHRRQPAAKPAAARK